MQKIKQQFITNLLPNYCIKILIKNTLKKLTELLIIKKMQKLFTEMEQIIENKIDAKKDVLATKEDIAAIKIEIVNTKTDLLKWIVSLFLSLFVTMGLMIIGLYFKK